MRTKPWVTTVSIGVIVLLYFLIVWLLVGEIDLLNKDYIVPVNGTLWSGKVTNDNAQWLWDKYHNIKSWGFADFDSFKNECVGNKYKIIAFEQWFNPNVLIYVFIGIALSIIYPLFFKLFKWGNYDIIPLSLTTSIVCTVFFLTALIPYWGESNEFWRELLRMVIACACGLISFFITNSIVNKFFITTRNAQTLANELKSEKKAADVYNNDLNNLVDNYRKENDKEYIDLDDINKK